MPQMIMKTPRHQRPSSRSVPSWIPGPFFWTYVTGLALIAGGPGLLLRQTLRLAALLSGINWKRVGPILDAERWEHLATMTDEEGQRASAYVLELWRPDWEGDHGEGLLLHQRVFARARQRGPRR